MLDTICVVCGVVCVSLSVVVVGILIVGCERPRCGGRSCDGGRLAALDVADDIEVRVRLDGVMGVWVW